jgi:hypothetical protein
MRKRARQEGSVCATNRAHDCEPNKTWHLPWIPMSRSTFLGLKGLNSNELHQYRLRYLLAFLQHSSTHNEINCDANLINHVMARGTLQWRPTLTPDEWLRLATSFTDIAALSIKIATIMINVMNWITQDNCVLMLQLIHDLERELCMPTQCTKNLMVKEAEGLLFRCALSMCRQILIPTQPKYPLSSATGTTPSPSTSGSGSGSTSPCKLPFSSSSSSLQSRELAMPMVMVS